MALTKKAKLLNDSQVKAVLAYLETTRYPVRNRLMFLLSIKAGLRAKEIAALRWYMVTDSEGLLGNSIELPNQASKGRSGRSIPLNKQLKEALYKELQQQSADRPIDLMNAVIRSERGDKLAANSIVMFFKNTYSLLNYDGCSSHTGRRTFITKAAREISRVGGSLRDVQELAGHSSRQTTQGYIEGNREAKRKLVELI